LTQLCSRRGGIGRPFCAFLHGLGQERTIDMSAEFVNNLPTRFLYKIGDLHDAPWIVRFFRILRNRMADAVPSLAANASIFSRCRRAKL
ncbi:hypothetical protein SB783_38585, partial [Paraburkholderia sp. SIMBA_009]